MMTKEEIYLKHVGKGTNVRSVYYQRCLDAMEEYAEQSRQAAVSGSLPPTEFLVKKGLLGKKEITMSDNRLLSLLSEFRGNDR